MKINMNANNSTVNVDGKECAIRGTSSQETGRTRAIRTTSDDETGRNHGRERRPYRRSSSFHKAQIQTAPHSPTSVLTYHNPHRGEDSTFEDENQQVFKTFQHLSKTWKLVALFGSLLIMVGVIAQCINFSTVPGLRSGKPEQTHQQRKAPSVVNTEVIPDNEDSVTDEVKNTTEEGVSLSQNIALSTEPVVRRQLNCEDIARLEIVRVIGEGKQKITFEVELPWGERAVAKRCRTKHCVEQDSVKREAALFRGLREQYGDKAVDFYGECDAPYRSGSTMDETYLQSLSGNFAVGYTALIELGEPLLTEWPKDDVRFYGQFAKKTFTEDDFEDLRVIARQYANYTDFPLFMAMPGYSKTDNKYPQQYMRTKAGLRHVDLDMVYKCRDGDCSGGLDLNCKVVLQQMARLRDLDPRYNCTLAYSLHTKVTRQRGSPQKLRARG